VIRPRAEYQCTEVRIDGHENALLVLGTAGELDHRDPPGDDPIADGQTEARADAKCFCQEERIEYPLQSVPWNSSTRVVDLDHDATGSSRLRDKADFISLRVTLRNA
jgi:hypothetical protein